MQDKYRTEQEATLQTFQSNMTLLGIHSDNIAEMFKHYQREKRQIQGSLNNIKESIETIDGR